MDGRTRDGYEDALLQIVSAMPIEQRLAGLSPEQLILALPDEALRALSLDYIVTLSAETVAAIRKRIGPL
jgi:hypothetical protein